MPSAVVADEVGDDLVGVEPVEVSDADAERTRPPRRRRILGRPRFAGLVGALLCLWPSFWPTLMPRTFVTQGAMSGISMAFGYGVFTLLALIVRRRARRLGVVQRRRERRLPVVGEPDVRRGRRRDRRGGRTSRLADRVGQPRLARGVGHARLRGTVVRGRGHGPRHDPPVPGVDRQRRCRRRRSDPRLRRHRLRRRPRRARRPGRGRAGTDGRVDREVLVVATTTGTGWIDPNSATTLELMHGGDTTIASLQYSFLPSWIAFLVDEPVAAEAGAALFDAVYRRWAELPEDTRPQLIVYGLSLGSFGAEAGFAGTLADSSIANLQARTDGVLLAGPTHDNPVRQQIAEDREPRQPRLATGVRRRGGRAVVQRRRRARRARRQLGSAAPRVRRARVRIPCGPGAGAGCGARRTGWTSRAGPTSRRADRGCRS